LKKCLWYLFTISEENGLQTLPEILIDPTYSQL
jgi:hypothetical protein